MPSKKPFRILSVNVDPYFAEEVDVVAREVGLNRNQAIKRALIQFIHDVRSKSKDPEAA